MFKYRDKCIICNKEREDREETLPLFENCELFLYNMLYKRYNYFKQIL